MHKSLQAPIYNLLPPIWGMLIKLLVIFILGSLGLTKSVQAHTDFQNPLRVYYSETEIETRIYVSVREICATAGIPIDAEGNFEKIAVEDAVSGHLPYVLKHFQMEIDDQIWQPKLHSTKHPVAWEAKTAPDANKKDLPDRLLFQYELIHSCAKPPQKLKISHQMMADIPHDDGTPFKLHYSVSIMPPDGSTPSMGLISPGKPEEYRTIYAQSQGQGQSPALGPQTGGQRFSHFLTQGLEHVLLGYDHLLFAAALVLGVWGLWPAVKLMGIFTLAHSLTVTLAAYHKLGFIPSGFPTEPLIAGSIVIVALEGAIFPESKFGWRRLSLIFLFGMVHGLGFAEKFSENMAGLDSGLIALALVAFCLGVELAHLCVVAPLATLLGWGHQRGGAAFQKRAQFWGSLIVAIGGLYYFAAALRWLPPGLMPDVLLGAK